MVGGVGLKILKNNFTKKREVLDRKKTCSECKSVFEYDDEDVTIGALGCAFVICPCCGEEVDIEEKEVTLTKDNVQFPQHFFRFDPKCDSETLVTNEEVKKHIQRAITYFRNHKEEDDCGFISNGSGDAYFCTKRYPGDEDYEVVVAKGYWETYIPFEEEDYLTDEDGNRKDYD